MTDKVHKSLHKLTSIKHNGHGIWNSMYQSLYDKAKNIISQDAYMKFYDASKPLFLNTDISGVSLGASPL